MFSTFRNSRAPAFGAALAAAAAAALALTVHPASSQQPTAVIVAPIEEKTLVNRIEALGTLRPNARVDITAPVTEQVEVLHADDGQRVKRGDKLVELRHQQEIALLEEAEATLDEALEQLEDAENLFKRGAGSESQLTLRRRQTAVARARVKAAKAQIADRVITAPFAGRIGIRTVSPGATVEPGDLILRLIDDHVLKLDFSVPNIFLSELRPGAEIEARARAFPGEVFRGRIRTIDAEADPVTRAVLVRAFIPNDELRLLPGLLMEVELLLKERRAVTAPEESLIPFGDEVFVLLLVDRDGQPHVERRKVVVGAREVGLVEIVDGLAAGDLVVVEGGIKVRPGQPVTPIRRSDDAKIDDAKIDDAKADEAKTDEAKAGGTKIRAADVERDRAPGGSAQRG